MKLSNDQLIENLKLLGLVEVSDNSRFNYYNPISYSGFKNRASIHRYGNKLKVVFIGHPKLNLFGFYVMYDTDSNVMKEAYNMFIRLIKGDMTEYNNGDIQWGNAGIPLVYGDLRQNYFL